MKGIMGLRDQGGIFAGRFVCENKNAWEGTFMNDNVHYCRNDLKFMQVYRLVLSKEERGRNRIPDVLDAL